MFKNLPTDLIKSKTTILHAFLHALKPQIFPMVQCTDFQRPFSAWVRKFRASIFCIYYNANEKTVFIKGFLCKMPQGMKKMCSPQKICDALVRDLLLLVIHIHHLTSCSMCVKPNSSRMCKDHWIHLLLSGAVSQVLTLKEDETKILKPSN